jgi:putative MATE family efflux protein
MFVKDKQFYRTYLRLTLIIAAQNVISQGVNLTDNLMLGIYSENTLAGATIANQILFLLTMVVFGGGDAIVAISSQYWGRRELMPIKKVINAALTLTVSLALISNLVVFFWPAQVLSIFTDKPETIAAGVDYLRISGFAYTFFSVTYILLYAFRSVEIVNISILISGVSFVSNLILNWLLIFGNLGFPKMGASGAALATVISRVIEFSIVLVYLFVFDKHLKCKPAEILKGDKQSFRHFVRVGAPMFMAGFFWALGQWAQTAILGRMDTAVVAANSIAAALMQVLSVVVFGSSSATAVIVGKTIGERKIREVKEYAVTFQIMYIILGVATGLLIFALRDVMLSFYNVSDAARGLAREFLGALAVITVGIAYHMSCMVGIVRGGGDAGFVLITDMIFVWLVVIPLSYAAAFIFHMPPVVVFCFLKCDQVLKSFVACFKVNRFTWIRVLTQGE